MSQFDQKFYRHFPRPYTPEGTEETPQNEADETVTTTTWWEWRERSGTALAGWVTALILLAVLLLTRGCGGMSHYAAALLPTGASASSSSARAAGAAASGVSYPDLILPDAAQLAPEPGEPVTLRHYLYFAREHGGDLPSYIDPDGYRLIAEKAPECAELSCPVTGVSPDAMRRYTDWLADMGRPGLEAVAVGKIYVLRVR
jgi:hypothetical protein